MKSKWYHQCVEMEVFPLAFHQLWRSVKFFSWWYSVYCNSYIFDGACFLELQWNLSAFWHFTSLKVCQIFFLMIYSNSFFVDRICIFEWQWNLRRVFFLFLVCFNGMWWRGGVIVSILSHLSFVTTVSGVVKRVQKQTFSPCQRSLLHPRRRKMWGAAAAGWDAAAQAGALCDQLQYGR